MAVCRIAVILSTYNGEKYLAEQIESILAQDDADVSLLIRDDGSHDSTVALVRDFASRHPNIRCMTGPNKGITESFLMALNEADPRCQFFAFSDQDDVWDRRKLANAVETLRSTADPTLPLLYCSRLEVVDENLAHLAYTRPLRDIGFKNALFQNVVSGCTIVMNRAARDLVLRGGTAQSILMHDWWCYLAVSAFGKVLYDDRPGIKYRQHANNQLGSKTRLLERILWRCERTLNGLNGRFPSEQNDFFLRLYGKDLPDDKRCFAEMTLAAKRSLHKRITLASSREILMQSTKESFITRLGILLNKF